MSALDYEIPEKFRTIDGKVFSNLEYSEIHLRAAWANGKTGTWKPLGILLREYMRMKEVLASSPPAVPEGPRAVHDVLAERERQKSVEGWTDAHDDEHASGQLSKAAAAYIVTAFHADKRAPVPWWPWEMKWWKPKSARQDLVRAGALILAEIERLDRAASPSVVVQPSEEKP